MLKTCTPCVLQLQAATEVAGESSIPEEALADPLADSPVAELPQNAEDADEDDLGELPNDTLAAVLALRAQFPSGWSRDVPPLVLKSQIYSIVKDRTIVDRQLDELRSAAMHRARRLDIHTFGASKLGLILNENCGEGYKFTREQLVPFLAISHTRESGVYLCLCSTHAGFKTSCVCSSC